VAVLAATRCGIQPGVFAVKGELGASPLDRREGDWRPFRRGGCVIYRLSACLASLPGLGVPLALSMPHAGLARLSSCHGLRIKHGRTTM
jgi:hypothetical protein